MAEGSGACWTEQDLFLYVRADANSERQTSPFTILHTLVFCFACCSFGSCMEYFALVQLPQLGFLDELSQVRAAISGLERCHCLKDKTPSKSSRINGEAA